MEIVLLVGRAIFGLYWVSAAIQNLLGLEKGAANAGSHGVPFPRLSIIATAPILIAGGLSIAFGFYSEAGAILLRAFLIPGSVFRPPLLDVADPQRAKAERRTYENDVGLTVA